VALQGKQVRCHRALAAFFITERACPGHPPIAELRECMLPQAGKSYARRLKLAPTISGAFRQDDRRGRQAVTVR